MVKSREEVQKYLDFSKASFNSDGWWGMHPEQLAKQDVQAVKGEDEQG